jgi:hypothetical protein
MVSMADVSRSGIGRLLAVVMVFSNAAWGAQQIEVTAHFADVPGGVEVPATMDKLAKLKGTNLLSSPKIIVAENVPGDIEIVQDTPVPGATQVEIGVSLQVKASVTEKGNIWFSGRMTDRSRGGGQKTERLETAGFATREWYFSGWTPNAGTVLIRTTPVTAQVMREGKTVESTRELVVFLEFKKQSSKPATTTKKAPSKTGMKKTGSSRSSSSSRRRR